MKIGKKSWVLGSIIVLLLTAVLVIWNNDISLIRGAETEATVKTRTTLEEDKLLIDISIPNPESGEYTFDFEGVDEVTAETIEAGIINKDEDEVAVLDNGDGTSKKVVFFSEDAQSFDLTVEVQKSDDSEQSVIRLFDPKGGLIVERNLDFTALAEFSAANELRTGSWSGANVFPTDSISLSDVFRSPIGSGPNLMDEGRVLQIVGGNSQTGAIWSKRKINLLRDFSFTSYIYLGNGNNGTTTSNSTVADGITMAFQNDPRMETTPNTVVGPGGAGLGIYSVNSANSSNFIRNAIALEFDPFNNGNIDSNVSTSGGHIAVMIPAGRNDQSANRTHHGLLVAPTNSATAADRMSNDTWRTLDIRWDAATRTLHYTIDGFGSNSYTVANLNTAFGGTSVYWGFTGATGQLMMDARIAMTEIPGNTTHDLKVQNITQSSAIDTTVKAFKNDTVRFTDSIVPDEDAILSGDGASVVINLPEGLAYKSGTVFFDGNPVDDSQLEISNQTIKLSNLQLTTSRSYDLTFDAEVTTDDDDISLPTIVEVFSASGAAWGISGEAVVTIPNIGSVTFHYLNDSGTPIAGVNSKTIYGELGEGFSESPQAIPYYAYDRTEGSATGNFTDTPQTVNFYYKRNQVSLTVRFVDEEDNNLRTPITQLKDVVSIVDLTGDTAITAVIDDLLGDHYEVIARPDDEDRLEIPETNITVKYVFKQTDISSVLTVEFVNEVNQVLSGYTVIIDAQIGDTINLLQQPNVTAQLANLETAGYEIAERPSNETAVAINAATVTVQYKIRGLLSLTSVPSALDFGSLTYNATAKRVENPYFDENLVVTDTRASAEDGWHLTATLSVPMKNQDGKILNNALRYVYNGDETILDSNAVPVYLNTTGAAGVLNISDTWGDSAGTDGVKLQIESSDIVYTGDYVGVITWKVMAGQP
ncbi:lectin-like domain-containing protein [Enterococcus larvae]|uniref:lectin-like domain-containing protein n=1 Tax=Enterococcus larvae TaxID=2794352 RepID=UPI003F39C51F